MKSLLFLSIFLFSANVFSSYRIKMFYEADRFKFNLDRNVCIETIIEFENSKEEILYYDLAKDLESLKITEVTLQAIPDFIQIASRQKITDYFASLTKSIIGKEIIADVEKNNAAWKRNYHNLNYGTYPGVTLSFSVSEQMPKMYGINMHLNSMGTYYNFYSWDKCDSDSRRAPTYRM